MTLPRFHQQFKRTGAPNLLRQFGEEVTYYAGGMGTGRTVLALVDRSETPRFTLRFRNSSCDGISSAELDTGDDEISFSFRYGETATKRSIVELLDDSNGMTRVVCE